MRINITSWYTIGLILIIGYVFIFISVITSQHSSDEFQRLQQELEYMKREVISKSKELKIVNNIKTKNDMIVTQAPIIITKPPELTTMIHNNRLKTHGVIILGMHRSGTSIIGGLMNKMGLNTGGPLIQPAFDNEKGFFERLDVVLQNDYLLSKQGSHYAYKSNKYDSMLGLQHIMLERNEGKFFAEGRRALQFLNNENNYPWMLKDPRLCITIRTWIPLLNFVPSILFTYRHPLDVGLSMNKRTTENFPVQKGIKLWYVYNKSAIKHTQDICRVIASHRNVMKSPRQELDRIYNELIACGLNVPKKVSDEDIKSFIDPKLQHGKTTLLDNSCNGDNSAISIPDTWQTNEPNHLKLYREAMKLYCALEDGSALTGNYKFDDTIIDE